MGCNAFTERDEDVLTRNEEQTIRSVDDAPKTKAATQQGCNKAPLSERMIGYMVTPSKNKARTVQAKTASPHVVAVSMGQPGLQSGSCYPS